MAKDEKNETHSNFTHNQMPRDGVVLRKVAPKSANIKGNQKAKVII